MAKATLRNAEHDDWMPLGRAVERTRQLCGLSLKEFAHAVQRNPRQVARWILARERTQVDAIFAVSRFRKSFIEALAEEASGQGVVVTTRIEITRSA
jgi:hypothetical protein